MGPSGSGAEPGEDGRIQEPAQGRSNAATSPSSNGAPSAPRATPLERPHREQAGGGSRGADGSRSAAAGVDRKGKKLAAVPFPAPFPPSSAGSIPDFALAFGVGGSSSTAGRRMMVPRDATRPFDYRLVFEQLVRQQQAAIIEEGEEEQQVKSSHAKDALSSKEKEKLPQVKAFKKLIEKVMKWKRHGRWNSTESTSSYRKEKLLKFFSTYDKTQDIFVFLRLLVAIQICSHREVYEPLIPGLGGNYSLEVWCFRRVTPARLYTDHVMMTALAGALEVPLKVETFEGGYAPDIYTGPGVPRPSVTLLYTGNHYEIIYPRAPSAESSSHQASQREHPADQGSSQQTSQREHPADQSSSQQTSQREHPADQGSSQQVPLD